MREILFRGKRTGDYEWIEGSLCTTIPSDEDFYTISYFDFEGYYIEEKVILETVGQYTGVTDKNGTKIFEGDIVKRFWSGKMCIYQVDYDNGLASFIGQAGTSFTTFGYDSEEFEVIGNIYDNPELLGGNG